MLEDLPVGGSDNPVLNQLKPHQQDYVLERLSTSLPLHVTSKLIRDGVYWRRCCEHHWDICDVTDYENSWKRMFFERRLENLIEEFVPGVTDLHVILDMIPHSREYVRHLNITQLRVSDDKTYLDHFDFNTMLHKLCLLEELHVICNVRVCRMNFEWNMVELSEQDGECLAKAAQHCKTLKRLKVQRSGIRDQLCQLMCPYMYHHHSLRELDLCHNLISEDGAKALSDLLIRSRLETLNICDNHIHDQGAKALAFALSKNSTLLNLNLRLNRVKDDGGEALSKALLVNHTLQHLNLAANDVTGPTAVAMANALVENKTIKIIILSCNMLGPLDDSDMTDSRLQI
ncbi:dynein regulatory complex subunit 5-like isoform X2 [Cynoglossus semilaevis]|uniref:dynein regulatory complex subunit 5-like isoform X2 n=1 Tax=Cynoglossus semilaevis TaxID=244447 RepID=UPI000D62DBD9|nr:dynein regulatory complex subunit 5-like isoform X2 [Cynoglossus semilaevis]